MHRVERSWKVRIEHDLPALHDDPQHIALLVKIVDRVRARGRATGNAMTLS
jgi:hypothetical protein